MSSRNHRPRCSIQIVNVEDEVVEILDEGAAIAPGTPTTPYREVWTEEEDLAYVDRAAAVAPDGSTTVVERSGDVHGNLGYELSCVVATGEAELRVDYFTVSPSVVDGQLALTYEPRSVTVSGKLGQGAVLDVAVDLQAGFSEARGRPDFKQLRVTCR